MKKLLIPAALIAATLSANVFAGEGPVNLVLIETVGVINGPVGLHTAGNMELKIKGGFTLPPGVYCDSNYITTRKTMDPDRAVLSLMSRAQPAGQRVNLYITDNAAYSAYPGRCSLLAAGLN